ncbi:hypothetical protein ROZALSC1DRAFT_27699 [Rozella allomycis CSF55]|uniref:Uncharacterized protein n=1 Tax=Rozella allomycis (strain CSF55) TaxID=988480 RepID=A0A4P9YNL7_ROZAC|nr:hypothetical protein ROZALSC1DRAFT_27699 [Rozella allomycis CSF55]
MKDVTDFSSATTEMTKIYLKLGIPSPNLNTEIKKYRKLIKQCKHQLLQIKSSNDLIKYSGWIIGKKELMQNEYLLLEKEEKVLRHELNIFESIKLKDIEVAPIIPEKKIFKKIDVSERLYNTDNRIKAKRTQDQILDENIQFNNAIEKKTSSKTVPPLDRAKIKEELEIWRSQKEEKKKKQEEEKAKLDEKAKKHAKEERAKIRSEMIQKQLMKMLDNITSHKENDCQETKASHLNVAENHERIMIEKKKMKPEKNIAPYKPLNQPRAPSRILEPTAASIARQQDNGNIGPNIWKEPIYSQKRYPSIYGKRHRATPSWLRG